MALQLRPYQEEDVQFLLRHDCGGCFNEQRTGKTPTAITVMKRRNVNKLLVITTTTSIHQWCDEVYKWSDYNVLIANGTKAQKEKAVAEWHNTNNCVLIVSYDSFKTTISSDGLLKIILTKPPEGVILDEAHRIKNPKTANAKAVFKLIPKVKYRLALTGTPAPNKAYEVWSILHFILPEMFKSYWNFIQSSCRLTTRYTVGGRSYQEVGALNPTAKRHIQDVLKEYCTQRKRADVMPWLPEKEYTDVKLIPTKEQNKYLKELKTVFETEGIVTQGVLDQLIRMRQICLAPALLDLKGASPKLNWVIQYFTDYPEQPTIVFTKFTSFIKKILAPTLNEKQIKYACITGSTTTNQRKRYIKDFQTGKFNCLIINIDAGKEALTLDKAEVTIFTDKYPPVSDIQQAEDRFIATTEANANKGHKIYNLYMKGTYDEEIYKLLDKRASEVDIINNFIKYIRKEQ